MPGKVIEGHMKLESDCRNCHVLMRKAEQDRLCLDCHKEVAQDIAHKTGHHGRIRIASCRSCHTEHKGRTASIAPVDEARFDHASTDFEVQGKHLSVQCRACHKPGAKFRAAPSQCVDCHGRDDVHRRSLGTACADCHTEKDWKDTRFDHGRTRFALIGQHANVRCTACHKSAAYKDTPQACASCHRQDDRHKTRFGEKCETCHTAKAWSDIRFEHDKATAYPLRGRHSRIECESCHTTALYKSKLSSQCSACHRKDDKHRGALGQACERCHVEHGWREASFDHDRTPFKLLGKHALMRCAQCHRQADPRSTPSACRACHQDQDKHKGRFGDRCGACHTAESWRSTRFEHDRDTAYALRGKHRTAACESCHTQPAPAARLKTECAACHAKDDVHAGQEGARCEQCHRETGWKTTSFDHARSAFALTGSHLGVECHQCHRTTRFKDAEPQCVACHRTDDVHEGRFGTRCDTCHNARAWKSWDFDHGRRTRFVLDGGHLNLDCYACHSSAARNRPALPTACSSCHARDDVHEGAFGPRCERCHVTSSFHSLNSRIGVPMERAPLGGSGAGRRPASPMQSEVAWIERVIGAQR